MSAHSAADLASGRIQDNGSPPLYFLVLREWTALLGTSEVAARSLSVVFGVLAVPLLGFLGRRLIGAPAGMLAAFLLALSPLAVELSDEARTYSLTMLLGIADMLFFVRWREKRRLVDLLGLALFTFLACWSHLFAFAIPIAQAVAVASYGRREPGLYRGWATAMAIAAGLWCSSWLLPFLAQVSRREVGPERWVFQVLGTPVALTLGRSFAWSGSPPVSLAAACLLVVGLFAPVALRGVRALRDSRFVLVLLASWLLTPMLAPLAVAFFTTPPYVVRHASVGLPPLLLLTAAGLQALRPRLRVAAAVLMVAACGYSVGRFSTLPFKDDWRGASRFIAGEMRGDQALLFDPDHEVESFLYYARGRGDSPPVMIGVMGLGADGEIQGMRVEVDGARPEPSPRDWAPVVLGRPVVWVVLCHPATEAAGWEAWMAARGYRRTGTSGFHRVDVLRFER